MLLCGALCIAVHTMTFRGYPQVPRNKLVDVSVDEPDGVRNNNRMSVVTLICALHLLGSGMA